MAVTETLTKTAVTIKLDTGDSTASGSAKTVSVNLGKIEPSRYDAQKAKNIVDLLIPCFKYDHNATVKTTSATLAA